MISAGTIIGWLCLAWVAVQIRNGLASDPGKELLAALCERLRNKKET